MLHGFLLHSRVEKAKSLSKKSGWGGGGERLATKKPRGEKYKPEGLEKCALFTVRCHS